MASLNRVPIVDVNRENVREVWPSMIHAMSSSSFIALDTELSGLGNRKKLNAKCIEERYSNIRESARSRSILSLGISCFRPLGSQGSNSQPMERGASSGEHSNPVPSSYIVQTFNILLLCEEDFVVEPSSLRFLVQHGFDFNRQYDKGMSYYRGEDRETDKSVQSVRHLFTELISMGIPIVLHNGLVDLMFLYENLYTSLPQTSAMFLADLEDMFPAGVVDTKYITDYEHLMQASYLEYVFRKCLKDTMHGEGPPCSMHFPYYPNSYPHVTYRNCGAKPPRDVASHPQEYKEALCGSYAGHGWCAKGEFCQKSHDIDLIIDVDNYNAQNKSRKRKRRKERQEMQKSQILEAATKENETAVSDSQANSDSIDMEEESESDQNGDKTRSSQTGDGLESQANLALNIPTGESAPKNGGHRAGYDAFMTGFFYAIFLHQSNDGKNSKTEEWKNKLYLCGKDYPLTISKSAFSKQSKQHLDKLSKIRLQKNT